MSGRRFFDVNVKKLGRSQPTQVDWRTDELAVSPFTLPYYDAPLRKLFGGKHRGARRHR